MSFHLRFTLDIQAAVVEAVRIDVCMAVDEAIDQPVGDVMGDVMDVMEETLAQAYET